MKKFPFREHNARIPSIKGEGNQTNISNDDDENPHLHLHLLTHPQQQVMHIRCTDKVCSNCANQETSGCGSVGTQIQSKRRSSFSDMDSPSLREDVDSVKCKIHGQRKSSKNRSSQKLCHIHGSTNAGENITIMF